jgi:hypothetical protein
MTTCPTCKFQVFEEDGHRYCSEFCVTTCDKEKQEFLNAKDGDFCVYPCRECGCPIEDVYDMAKPICGGCGPKVRAKAIREVLVKALPFLSEELRVEAQAALDA